MKIATFKAKCNKITCQLELDVPVLSDFSYGEFLYGSIDGKSVNYYCELDCQTWKFVEATVSQVVKDKNQSELGAVVQSIIGLIADRDEKDVYFTQDIYCPGCKSKVLSIDTSVKTGLQEYVDLSFTDFESMNPSDKKSKVCDLVRACFLSV